MRHFCMIMFSVMCLASVSAAVWLFIDRKASQPDEPLLVEFDDANFEHLPLGNHTFCVRITNPNSSPKRVLGLTTGCKANACFLTNHQQPVPILPGESITCSWSIELRSPGVFELPLTVFVEENGIRAVSRTIKGTAIASN